MRVVSFVFLSSRRIDKYAIWPTWVTTWPCPEVKFWPWPFKVMLYMFRWVLTRQTRWCQNNCSIISNTEVITEKLVSLKNAVFDLFVTSDAVAAEAGGGGRGASCPPPPLKDVGGANMSFCHPIWGVWESKKTQRFRDQIPNPTY